MIYFKARKFISQIIIILLMFLVVNASTEQIILQTVGSGARSYYPYIIMLITILFIIVLLINKRLLINNSSLSIYISIFTLYTLIVIPYYLIFNDIEYIISGYGSIMLLYVSGISNVTRPFINQRHLIKMLIPVLIVTGIIGILQYLTNSTVVRTYDTTTGFDLGDSMFYEVSPPQMRGFSLFYSALDFGYFLIFMLGLSISINRKYKYILIIFTLAALYCTLTRNIYVGAAISVLGIIIFNLFKRYQYIIYSLPFVSFLFGLFVAGIDSGKGGVSSSNSLSMRRGFWANEIERLKELNILEILLGKGIFQSGDSINSKLFVDNTYLLLIAQFGIFGFLLFIFMYFSIIKTIVKSKKSAINTAIYGFVMAWPFLALFNIAVYPLSVFIFILMCSREKEERINHES